jgi:acetate kinase
MGGRILAINAGSSTLKWAVFAGGQRLEGGTLPAGDSSRALDRLGGVHAVGHRIVHGGRNAGPRRIDAALLAELRDLAPLDPDHMPAALALVDAVQSRAPDLPQVACFDTAFHADLPAVARVLALPRRYEAAGIRRYGFHGLSYAFLMEELARVDPAASGGRVVLAHLGSGSSLAAVQGGRCVDTTMGFTPNSGVAMGTRSGDLEPGVLLHLLRSEALSVDALDDLLSHRSGLLGISETTSDMRDLLARAPTDPRAAEAVAVFCYQVRKAVGAMAAAMGGVETLVFSGGIGAASAEIRARVGDALAHLGVAIDPARNAASSAVISPDGARCVVRAMQTDEESVVALATASLVAGEDP